MQCTQGHALQSVYNLFGYDLQFCFYTIVDKLAKVMKVKENSKQCGIKEKSEQFGILHIFLVSSFTFADMKMSSRPANHLVDFTIFQQGGGYIL